MSLIPIVVTVAALLGLCWCVIPGIKHWRYRRTICARPSSEDAWRELFPEQLPVVEQVLAIFCDAFLFRRQYVFRFLPEDVVMHIYRNTTGPIADMMQVQVFLVGLCDSFHLDLWDRFHENTTLRDVVAMVLKSPKEGESG